jgi:hypothetical protein
LFARRMRKALIFQRCLCPTGDFQSFLNHRAVGAFELSQSEEQAFYQRSPVNQLLFALARIVK